MDQDLLNIVIEETIDLDAVKHLEEELSFFGSDVSIQKVPPAGPQASILLLGVSSLAAIFGAAFLKKLGEKTAEDVYPRIKKALTKVHEKYFGVNPEYKLTIITSGKNKVLETKYSLLLGLYCASKDNLQAKFIYESDWSIKQFDQATGFYIDAMVEFVSNDSNKVRQLIIESGSNMQPHLIVWDFEKAELIKVNPFPNHVRI